MFPGWLKSRKQTKCFAAPVTWLNVYKEKYVSKANLCLGSKNVFDQRQKRFLVSKQQNFIMHYALQFHKLACWIRTFLLFSTFSPCFKKWVHFEMCFVCSFHNTASPNKVFIIARETLKTIFKKSTSWHIRCEMFCHFS